jgi:hypothetical protein
MDLNVKLQGVKHNLEQVWGVLVKLPGYANFLNFQNYFPKENSVV